MVPNSPSLTSESDESGDDHQNRLLNPRFDLLESHFNCKVPTALRLLYDNRAEIIRTGIFVDVTSVVGESQELYVQAYEPIDETIHDAFPGFERFLEFALCGGPFLYMIDPSIEDPEVHLFNMEGASYELTPLHVQLSQFVSAPRRYEDEVNP